MSSVDVLAIFAHRDDAELNAGGTLAKLARQGRRTGILDLTQGEMGTRGSAATRAAEAAESAKVLGVAVRERRPRPGTRPARATTRLARWIARPWTPPPMAASAACGSEATCPACKPTRMPDQGYRSGGNGAC